MIEPPASLIALLGRERATIPEVLAARCAQTPDSTFLLWRDESWSYGEALTEIRRFAGWLRLQADGGAVPRVAGFLANRPEALWAWLGTAWAGGTYVALNRQHKGDVLADMIRRSGAKVLVTEGEAVAEIARLDGLGLEAVLTCGGVDGVIGSLAVQSYPRGDASAGHEAEPVRPSDVAGLLFTSGTTGPAKAARIPHNMYARGAARMVDGFGYRADDVFHHWLPLYHLGGQLHMTMTAIVAGAAIALYPTFSLSNFWDQVAARRATVFCGFSAIVHMLWSRPERADDADNSLRVGLIGGIPPELHKPFESRFGLRIGEQYGGTEGDPVTLPGFDRDLPPGCAGVPGPDFQIAVLDALDRRVAPGTPGEIAIRPLAPDVMFAGYEGDDGATAAAWRNLWYHSGDLGVIDEAGFLHFKGRLKHAIRRRGENISSYEVERTVARCPGVKEVAVVGVPSDLGEEEVKAVVVAEPGAALVPGDIRDHCAARMAAFMVPRYVELRAALPYTPLGKVRRELLTDTGPGVWDAEAGGKGQGKGNAR